MSNANLEPMPFVRKFGGGRNAEPAPPSAETTASDYVDVLGHKVFKPQVSGACRKCGFVGHLPYQCRNFIQLQPGRSAVIDVSSTSSSSEGETPLVKIERAKRKEQKKLKKERKQAKKEKKKRKKKYDNDSSSEDEKKKKKRKKKRRHNSSNDSDGSSDDDKNKKKRKHKRRRRSSSSDSPDDRKRRRRSPSYKD